ncbi:kelch protein 40 [Biomphalaria glabrata]|nr:kelch protein 40 [Biomphalaria glabrata]
MELKDILPINLDLTNGLHSSKKKNDICITIGFKTFSINQSILSACSKYFQALMYSDTNKSKEMINLLIKGIDAHSFAYVLHMITKGKNKMTENNMLAMWRAAHHLKIEFLIEQCENFVNAHVTEENYLSIYQHAIAFKSETAYKKVISLMIKNFDRFIKTDTFLTLTPKTLIEILTSGGIKSHDNVIVAIFDWINYTRTERLQSCGESPKKNKPKKRGGKPTEENKTNESDGNADWDMEVNFNDIDLFSNTDNHPTNREELLGKLISLVQFDLITADGLRKLLDNDDVMENRDARNTVRRAISSQLENEKLVKLQLNAEEITPEAMSLSDLTIEDISSEVALASPQTQHVIFFIDRNQSLLALNILSNTILQVSFDIKGTFEDLFVLEHKLHILVSRSFVSPACQLRLYKISDFQSIICYFGPKNRTKFIINGTFHYAFLSCNKKSLKITGTKRPDPYQRTWATLDYYHDIGEVTSLVNFENEIVGFFSGEEEGKEATRIFSFNTTSRTFYPIVNLDGSSKNLASFTFEKRLFVIQGCGTLTELYRQDGFLQADFHPPLWDMPLEIFGAVVLNKTFLVMARLDNVQNLPTTCQFGRTKFVNLTNGANICQYMAIPNHWLKKN